MELGVKSSVGTTLFASVNQINELKERDEWKMK